MNAVTTEPIRISYEEDGALFKEGTEIMHRGKPMMAGWQKWLHIVIVVVVCGALAASGALKGDMLAVWVPLGLLPVFLWVIWRAYFPSQQSKLKRYQKLYLQAIGREKTFVTCDFGKGGYSMTTDQGNTNQQTWASLVKAVEHPEGILLYTSPKIAQWFPRRFFTAAAYEQVIDLVRAQVPNFQRADVPK